MSENSDNRNDDFAEHWREMPEFVQEDLLSKRRIVVHFRNGEDVEAFAQLLEQRITPKQKSLWFPYLEKTSTKNLIYVDES